MNRSVFTAARITVFALCAAAFLALPYAGYAQEGTPTESLSREKVEADSVRANSEKQASNPGKSNPGAKRDETHKGKDPIMQDAPAASGADAKPLSATEKAAALSNVDEITAFDPALVIGSAKPGQVYYQEASSPTMKVVEPLHDKVLYIITAIVIVVMALMLYVMLRFNKRRNPVPQSFTHNKMVEIVWTVVPILILVFIAIPSIRIHYNYYNNETIITNPDLTVKVVGHQWYWSYEYPDQAIAFDSNMKADKDLAKDEPRLLAVDNPLVVPVGKVVRLQITSADVIHAWAMPAFGVKKGAVPGRLNETWFTADKEGIYYGQCSVLCGKSHGFMPIQIIAVSPERFDAWVRGAKLKFASDTHLQFASLR